MAKFSWYTDNKPHVSTYLNGASKKRYLVVDGIDVIGRAVMHYKPNRKGGHTHNAFYNALNRLIFRGKNSRQFHRKKQFKKEYVATFYENMKIKENRRLIMETLNKHTRKMSGKQPLEAECHS